MIVYFFSDSLIFLMLSLSLNIISSKMYLDNVIPIFINIRLNINGIKWYIVMYIIENFILYVSNKFSMKPVSNGI